MEKIITQSLPYFLEDSVSIFLINGEQNKVPLSCFQDVTTEGERFHQFYKFLIGGDERWYLKKPKDGLGHLK